MQQSQIRFIRQQGVTNAQPDPHLYAALMLQPRLVGGLVAVGILFQSPWVFLTLSAILWWSALVPTHNPFDAIYNHLVADPRGLSRLGVAPAPRRFAAGMAATVALMTGVALVVGAGSTAWVGEGMLASGVVSAVFLRFCEGAYVVLRPSASTRHPGAVRWDRFSARLLRPYEGSVPGSGTGGVPCVWNVLTVCSPHACPLARSACVQTTGFQSGSRIR